MDLNSFANLLEKTFSSSDSANLVLKEYKGLSVENCQLVEINADRVSIEVINVDSTSQSYGFEVHMNEEDNLSDIDILVYYNDQKSKCYISINKVSDICICKMIFRLPLNLIYQISNGNGNIKLQDVKSENVAVSAKNGNVKVFSSTIKDLSISCGNGNVKIEESDLDQARLENDNGNIKIGLNNKNEYKLILKSNRGNVKLSNVENNTSSSKTLTCTTTNGNIKISC